MPLLAERLMAGEQPRDEDRSARETRPRPTPRPTRPPTPSRPAPTSRPPASRTALGALACDGRRRPPLPSVGSGSSGCAERSRDAGSPIPPAALEPEPERGLGVDPDQFARSTSEDLELVARKCFEPCAPCRPRGVHGEAGCLGQRVATGVADRRSVDRKRLARTEPSPHEHAQEPLDRPQRRRRVQRLEAHQLKRRWMRNRHVHATRSQTAGTPRASRLPAASS